MLQLLVNKCTLHSAGTVLTIQFLSQRNDDQNFELEYLPYHIDKVSIYANRQRFLFDFYSNGCKRQTWRKFPGYGYVWVNDIHILIMKISQFTSFDLFLQKKKLTVLHFVSNHLPQRLGLGRMEG